MQQAGITEVRPQNVRGAPPSRRRMPEAGARFTNRFAASKLRDYADLLDQQGGDIFRARAYRRAADVVEGLNADVAQIFAEGGRAALDALPAIGRGIAAAIGEMVTTGGWRQLDRLRGDVTPESLFRSLPGVGPELARRIAEDADIETLEELETAVHADRTIRGIGPRRRRMLAAVLAQRLGRGRRIVAPQGHDLPPIALLIEVDRLYRERAAAGALRRIAPKRFNPTGEAWLPIMHVHRDRWDFTALFSNTALAHRLGRTRDWVVIYFEGESGGEGRCTIVTETRGALAGRRVVRGRESETMSMETDTDATTTA